MTELKKKSITKGKKGPNEKKPTLWITIIIHNATRCGETMFYLHLLALFIIKFLLSFFFFVWFYSLELFIILAMFFANLPLPFPYKYSINSMCYSFKYFYY
jgi:hypothetical protein